MLRPDGAHRPTFLRARRGGRRSSRHDHGVCRNRCARRLGGRLAGPRSPDRGGPGDSYGSLRGLSTLPGILHMSILSTPRPVPNRIVPVVAGAGLLALALPIYLLLGWRVQGWALAALLWVGGQGLALLLARLRLGLDNLAASGVLAFGMMFRSILVMIVLLVVAVNDGRLALSAALLYTAAYTLALGVSFVEYFSAEARR